MTTSTFLNKFIFIIYQYSKCIITNNYLRICSYPHKCMNKVFEIVGIFYIFNKIQTIFKMFELFYEDGLSVKNFYKKLSDIYGQQHRRPESSTIKSILKISCLVGDQRVDKYGRSCRSWKDMWINIMTPYFFLKIIN